MFIAKHNPSIQNLNPMALKNKLFNKLLEIFQKNKIPISQEKMTNIFGIIDSNLNINNKVKDNKLEKEFSEALLSIGNLSSRHYVKRKHNSFDDSGSDFSNKKKPIFEINSSLQKNKKDNFDLFKKDKDPNFTINIDEADAILNNLDYQEIKNDEKILLLDEPIKSKHYLIKQFTFDDFVLRNNHHNNHEEHSHSHISNQEMF